MTHITVLYRFRSCLRHDFYIPSCLLTTGSAHLYLCTLGTRLHVSGNPLLCFPCIQYHEYFWTLLPRCVTIEPTPNPADRGSTHFTCSVPVLFVQTDHHCIWPDAVQCCHLPISSPSRRGHGCGQPVFHWVDIIIAALVMLGAHDLLARHSMTDLPIVVGIGGVHQYFSSLQTDGQESSGVRVSIWNIVSRVVNLVPSILIQLAHRDSRSCSAHL